MIEDTSVLVERRTVVTAAAWAAPAIVLAQGLPMASTSSTPPLTALGVTAVRAAGPNWESTSSANLTPGFRFSSSGANTVDLLITKTGAAATLAELFTVYDSVPWSTGSGNAWAALSVAITGTKTLGITIKAIEKAVGTYTATIQQHGSSVVAGTAKFTVYKSGTTFQVRLGD